MSKHKPIFKVGLMAVLTSLYLSATAAGTTLDESRLRAGIAKRVDTMLRAQTDNDIEPITDEAVELKQIEPISVKVDGHEISLYAVKAGLEFSDGSAADDIMMVVDGSGQLQFSVQSVETGRSPFQAIKDRLQKKQIHPSLGETVFTGTGDHELVLASSPFCTYCRQAVTYFLAHLDLISNWRMLHMTYDSRPGNNTAVWAMIDGMETVYATDILHFAYTELEPVTEGTPEKISDKIIAQFMEQFPELKEKWGTIEQAHYFLKGKYEEKTRQMTQVAGGELAVQATPKAFIDGIPVVGWAPERYADLLNTKEEVKKERSYGQK